MRYAITMKWDEDKATEVTKRLVKQADRPQPKGAKVTTYLLLGRYQTLSIVDAANQGAILRVQSQFKRQFKDIAECDCAALGDVQGVLKAARVKEYRLKKDFL